MIFLLKGKNCKNYAKKNDKVVPYTFYLPGIWEPLTAWSGISENLTVVELLIKFPILFGSVRFIVFFACPFIGP
jgi:hypothetical protein